MRDLYAQLRISKDSPLAVIREALARCQDLSLRRDAEAVLCNSQRRKAYDEIHATAQKIAQLRASLGLVNSPHWSGHFSNSFSVRTGDDQSELERLVTKAKMTQKDSLLRRCGHVVAAVMMFSPRLTIIISVVLICWVYLNIPSCNTSWWSASPTLSAPETPIQEPSPVGVPAAAPVPTVSKWTCPELPLPRSGEIVIYEPYKHADRIAPFGIETSPGTHYLVKLVTSSSKEPVMMIFVRGGATVEVEVPTGTYEVRYASGQKWYGYEDDRLFGPETSCNKADSVFDFDIKDGRISGYTITLYKVASGNLHTSSIPRESF